MFTTVQLTSAHTLGTIVSFDTTAQAWAPAADASQLVGVITGAPFEQESAWYAAVTFAGTCLARTSRAIDPQGGGLAVENGGAYVGPLAGAGIVAPVAFDQPAPKAGDLVLIFLR